MTPITLDDALYGLGDAYSEAASARQASNDAAERIEVNRIMLKDGAVALDLEPEAN